MNKNAFTYVLEIADSPAALSALVKQMTGRGYETVGSAFRRGNDPRLLQAFVKFDEEATLT